jgi:hypothetical protein
VVGSDEWGCHFAIFFLNNCDDFRVLGSSNSTSRNLDVAAEHFDIRASTLPTNTVELLIYTFHTPPVIMLCGIYL